MAITKDATATSSGYTNNYVKSWNHTCSGSDRLLVVCVSISLSGDTISGVTYAGTSMTLAKSVSTSYYYAYIFYLVNPAEGTNSVQVTGSATFTYYDADSTSYNGVYQTTPLIETTSATGTSTTITASITPSIDGCLVVDCAVVASNYGTLTVGAGQTQTHNSSAWTGEGVASYTIQNTAASETMSWTNTSSYGWATAVAAFLPAGNYLFSANVSAASSAENIVLGLQSGVFSIADIASVSSTEEITLALNQPPTVALDTADEMETADTTPTLSFTATDPESDKVEFNIQIDTNATFDSQ